MASPLSPTVLALPASLAVEDWRVLQESSVAMASGSYPLQVHILIFRREVHGVGEEEDAPLVWRASSIPAISRCMQAAAADADWMQYGSRLSKAKCVSHPRLSSAKGQGPRTMTEKKWYGVKEL